MGTLVTILIVLIALFHTYVFVLEAFLWQKPATMKSFGMTPDAAASSKVLALNQGVYNLFIAAGLAWSLITSDPASYQFQIFFLGCVLVAAVTAGIFVNKRIMLVQGLPAIVTMLILIFIH